jgi:hypothetical protein
LKLDRDASFLSALETHKATSKEEEGQEEGWLTKDQVAMKEGLVNYLTNECQKELLEQILEGLPSRKHKEPWRAPKGHMQYEYCAETMKKKITIQENSMEVTASAGDIDKNDWEAQVKTITGGMGTKAIATGNKACTTNRNPRPAQELTEEQKAKQELIKNFQKLLQNMERDQRTFIRVAMLDKSKLPANLPPLIVKYQKLNQTSIATLISSLDEMKAMEPSQLQADKYQEVLNKSTKVRPICAKAMAMALVKAWISGDMGGTRRFVENRFSRRPDAGRWRGFSRSRT